MMRKSILALFVLLFVGINAQSQTFLSEDFTTFNDSILPPLASGWKNVDSTSPPNGQIWRFDNPYPRTVGAPMSGKVAILDSDWYGSSNSQDAYLTSPSFNASTATTVKLEFDHFFRNLNPNVADVELFDGANWHVIASYSGTTTANAVHESIDISTLAAGKSSVQIRFHYVGNWAWYWLIDNINIFQPQPADIAMISVDSLINGCSLDSIPISATAVNAGTSTITSFTMNYRLNGGTIVSENVTTNLLANDTFRYTFNQYANVSAVGNYNIEVFSTSRNDANFVNDTASGTSQHLVSYSTFPYIEDFENGNGGWLSGGTNSSWQHGIPNGTIINTAAGGTQAYVTNLSGDYNNGESSFIISPCFDFTSLAQPQLKMNIFIESESGWDGTIIQSSINGGATWQTIGALNDPVNWYNGNANAVNAATGSGSCWTASSPHGTGWVLAEHDLTGLAGQSSVRIRILHLTDGSVTQEGFAFDNVIVQDAPSTDIKLIAITAPISGCGLGTADSVKVLMTNVGSGIVDTIPLFYAVNAGTILNDTSFTALNPGDTLEFTFDSTSNFSMGGTYSIFASALVPNDGNYINDTVSTIVENTLNTLQILPYLETFDGLSFTPGTGFDNTGSVLGNGWIADPPSSPDFFWGARNSPTGSGGTGPDVDHTGNNGNFIYVEGSNGLTGSTASLTSPCIDLSAATTPRIEFWYHKFGNSMATMYIDISNGSTWTTVDSIVGQTQTANLDPYLLKDISLVAFAGNVIQVRFRSGQKTGFATDMAIDDVKVFEPGAKDAGVASIISPNTGCGLGTDSVTILITNNGTAQLDTVPVGYSLSFGPTVIDTSFASILPSDTVRFNFSTTVNLSTAGTYRVDAFTMLTGDSDFTNDSASKTVESIPQVTLTSTYFEDFELTSGGWTAYGTNSSWAWGTPIAVDISSAGSGNNAWVTNLSGFYNNSELSYLESPCFDMSTLTNDPTLYFQHTYITESGYDEGWMEVSLDGGVTWNKHIGNTASVNWYNNTTNQYWEGTSTAGAGVWVNAQTDLVGTAGNSNVKIRFVLSTDGSVQREGFGVDSLAIDFITNIEDQAANNIQFSIYPNPSEGQFILSNGRNADTYSVMVFDPRGKLVYDERMSFAAQDQRLIDLSTQAKGIYLIKISNAENSFTKRIVIH